MTTHNDAEKSDDQIEDELVVTDVLFDASMFAPYDHTQDLIFPPELKVNIHTSPITYQ